MDPLLSVDAPNPEDDRKKERRVRLPIGWSWLRHSTITLTLDTYGHLIAGSEAVAVASSAELTAIPMLATGTDGERASWALPTAVRGRCFSVLDDANLGQSAANSSKAKTPHDSKENAGFCVLSAAVCKAEGKGVEPSTACAATDFESAS